MAESISGMPAILINCSKSLSLNLRPLFRSNYTKYHDPFWTVCYLPAGQQTKVDVNILLFLVPANQVFGRTA